MRSARPKPPRRRRTSGPAVRTSQSRPSVRPTSPARAFHRTLDELRTGREAVSDIEGQLGALMALLRDPAPAIDAGAPDRLAGAVRQAGRALSALEQLRRLLP
jgi:hypothetical protein